MINNLEFTPKNSREIVENSQPSNQENENKIRNLYTTVCNLFSQDEQKKNLQQRALEKLEEDDILLATTNLTGRSSGNHLIPQRMVSHIRNYALPEKIQSLFALCKENPEEELTRLLQNPAVQKRMEAVSGFLKLYEKKKRSWWQLPGVLRYVKR